MPNEERMTIDERFRYLRIMQKQYRKGKRKERSQLLDQMEHVTGMHRKTLIRHMNGKIKRNHRRRQRGKSYGHEVDDALRVISESLDYICAERLTPSLVRMAVLLAGHGEMEVSPSLLEQLAHISVSTVRRRLKKIDRLELWRLPRRKGPKRPNPVTRDIPMRVIPWDEQQPGHFEVDLVHHCGHSASGDYVHTVQMIDVTTGWSERAAVLGRSQRVMEDAFRRISALAPLGAPRRAVKRLPFPVVEIHPDNGSEFFNHHLVRFWKHAVKGVYLTRSRPFHKNDNRFVEQKNSTLVRAYFGNERLDSVAQTLLLNQIYENMGTYYTLFQPVMRLMEKEVISTTDQVRRVRRLYDTAKTPFERLSATGAISQEKREELEQLRDRTNPRQLHRDIYDLIYQLSLLPGAQPGVTENVLNTLAIPIPA